MSVLHGFGMGIATQNSAGETIDVFYPNPLSNIGDDLAALVSGLSGPLDSDQESFSMIDRKIEGDQLRYCLTNNIAILAYSPLARGLLTGKVGPDRTFNEGDQRLTSPRFSVENRATVAAMLEEFRPVADKHGLTLAQLVIAWTVAKPGVTHVLCGARNPAQAKENAAAGNVALSDQDIEAIDRAIAAHAGDIP